MHVYRLALNHVLSLNCILIDPLRRLDLNLSLMSLLPIFLVGEHLPQTDCLAIDGKDDKDDGKVTHQIDPRLQEQLPKLCVLKKPTNVGEHPAVDRANHVGESYELETLLKGLLVL